MHTADLFSIFVPFKADCTIHALKETRNKIVTNLRRVMFQYHIAVDNIVFLSQ